MDKLLSFQICTPLTGIHVLVKVVSILGSLSNFRHGRIRSDAHSGVCQRRKQGDRKAQYEKSVRPRMRRRNRDHDRRHFVTSAPGHDSCRRTGDGG